MVFLVDWFIGKTLRSPGILEVRAPPLNYLFDPDHITPGRAYEKSLSMENILGLERYKGHGSGGKDGHCRRAKHRHCEAGQVRNGQDDVLQ